MKFRTLLSLALLCLVAFCAVPAFAAFESVAVPCTIDSGSSVTTVDVSLFRSNIKDLYIWVPELDAGDTGAVSMQLAFNDSSAAANTVYVTPNGWTNVTIGATADNAMLKGFSAVTNIYCGTIARFTATTSSNQVANRDFILYLQLEY